MSAPTLPPGPRAGPAGRPDASMSLLREAVERSLDPGYAVAAAERAARRESGGPAAGGARRRAAVSGVLALVLGLAVAGAVSQLRQPAPPEQREELLGQLQARTAEAAAAQEQVEALRAEVYAAQAAALAGDADDLVTTTERLGLLAATTPVTGPGLRVVLDDAPGARDGGVGSDPREAAESDDGLVLDRDLQVVVNGLFAAGAEAITINGLRLTSLASIRVAGQAILVDFQPLSPPYTVEAIGDPSAMTGRFAGSTAGTYLGEIGRRYGVQITSTAHESLHLDGGGTRVLRYARAGEGV